MTPREQPGEQPEDGATASSGAIDPGVLEAENIVCGAWEQMLLERRKHMESALEAAFVCCDTAYQYLAAAQRAGNPKTISNAHTALEQALELARKSSIACNRVRQASLKELNLPAREIDENAVAADATQPAPAGQVQDALGPETPRQAHHTGQANDVPPAQRLLRHVRRRLAQIIMRDQSLAPKPASTRRTNV